MNGDSVKIITEVFLIRFPVQNHTTKYGNSWNSMEVIADGKKITTFVNDMKVVDETIPEGKPFSNVSTGRVGFIGWGGTTAFRNIPLYGH
jgi:CRISPR/Cas system CMR-associated protein Cmr1 (group 7 of RAMP superfamily)